MNPRTAHDRAFLGALVRRCKPQRHWISFPGTAFCQYVSLNAAKGCDLTLRKTEGNHHLNFALDMAELQLELGLHAHLENPLVSAAWLKKRCVTMFTSPPWMTARFHQCRYELRGPAGGLHMKPTLVKTTSPEMARVLAKLCARNHTHEVVQGSATQASEEYPAKLALAIAKVVCGPEGTRKVGGPDVANFGSLHLLAVGRPPTGVATAGGTGSSEPRSESNLRPGETTRLRGPCGDLHLHRGP